MAPACRDKHDGFRVAARNDGERVELDTRSHRACVRSAAERAGRSDRANDRHHAGARQDWLAEPAYNIRRLVTLERLAAA